MKSSNVRYLASAAAIVAVLVLALFVALAPTAPVAAQNTACFRPVGGASFECGDGGSFVVADGAQMVVESGATFEVASGATALMASVNISGNGDVIGNWEVTDHIATQAELYIIPTAPYTVTNGGTITPDGSVMELYAAGTVGAALSGCTDGQLLILINGVNQTITVSETANARMAGDFAMGQYDAITFMGWGVTCVETARSNN